MKRAETQALKHRFIKLQTRVEVLFMDTFKANKIQEWIEKSWNAKKTYCFIKLQGVCVYCSWRVPVLWKMVRSTILMKTVCVLFIAQA